MDCTRVGQLLASTHAVDDELEQASELMPAERRFSVEEFVKHCHQRHPI